MRTRRLPLAVIPSLVTLVLAACAAGSPADDDFERRNPDIRDRGDRDADDPRDAEPDADDVDDEPSDDTAVADASDDLGSDVDADDDITLDDADAIDARNEDAADVLTDPPTDDSGEDATTDGTDDGEEDPIADATDTVDAEDAFDADDATDTVDGDAGDGGFDADPTRPPERGSYLYQRLAVGGLGNVTEVEIAPQNDIAIIADAYDIVRIYNLETGTFVGNIDIGPTAASTFFYFHDLEWAPDGSYALLVGADRNGSTDSGRVVRIDGESLRAASDALTALPAFETLSPPAAHIYTAVEWGPGENDPVLLSRNKTGSAYSLALRRYSDPARSFAFIGAQSSSAGCMDLAYANNEFGGPGIFVVCGENGYDGWYYTEIGGVADWRHGLTGLGNGNLGNSNAVAGHPTGMFALIVSWSGRSLYRFESGRLNGYSDAPRFSTLPVYGIEFAPDGLRALIFGQMSVADNAVILEYRYDAYSCTSLGSASCGITDVSVINFAAAPWIAPDNTSVNDLDWRSDCDGGLVVGGYSNWSGTYGFVGTFELEGGRDCAW